MKLNKRGQGLPVSTIILIVIGVVILVILIIGLTIGFNRIFPFIKPANNIKELTEQCSLACSTFAKYDYCSQLRAVSTEKETATAGGTLSAQFKAKCDEISMVAAFGIEKCTGIACGEVVYSQDIFAKLYCESIKSGLTANKEIPYTGGKFTCKAPAAAT